MIRRYGTAIGIVAAVAVFAWLTWQRRWISDDGLIFTRTVRQVLAGNGPVFNAFERVESDTSTLWTYVLVVATWLTRGDVVAIAIGLGGFLSVAGVGIALDATRRLHRGRQSNGLLVPAGVLILLGVYPFWDFATSGLETGLAMFWEATAWWLLVTLEPRRREWLIAFVIGLGPLVRPDLGLMTITFGIAAYLLVRPPRRRAIGLVGVAFALPFAYEIFRAGYYGALVPMPAVAKSATSAEWHRGFTYLIDFAKPYHLIVPFACIAVFAIWLVIRNAVVGRSRILVAAPIISGVLLGLYVVRVGGDFMHARMLLPPVFLVLLPLFVLPLRVASSGLVAVLAAWSLYIGITRNDHESHASADHVEDERAGYSHWTGRNHPIDPNIFVRSERKASGPLYMAYWTAMSRFVLVDDPLRVIETNPALPSRTVYVDGRLGTGGLVAPLDSIVADTLGLANPLGARITVTLPGWPGHEKPLPAAWLVAQFAAGDPDWVWSHPPEVAAARHAMTCGALAEMIASVREPMSVHRFFKNLAGSIGRTRLVIPSDAFEAEKKFCAGS